MILNKDTVITGKNVILVPYRRHHVPKYHTWMQDEELQRLTASEALTLKEEYEMQKSWREDEDKCTFIVLDRKMFNDCGDEVEAMIGDTNLFLTTTEGRLCAEAEIMIAEPSARGNRRGWNAMLLMFMYGILYLGVKEFIVKISCDNLPSIKMFTNMHFIEISRSQMFQEITYSIVVTEHWKDWLNTELGHYQIKVN